MTEGSRRAALPFIGLGVLVCATSGCAVEPGSPWGRLELVPTVVFAPGPDRLSEQGELLTVNDEAVKIDKLRLRIARISGTIAANAVSTTFDPAKPPPGYSLCHNGHCHKDDGTLPTYEEIQLELAGGEDAGAKVSWDTTSDWVTLAASGQALPLGDCAPSCDMDRGKLVAWRLAITGLEITGSARSTGKTGAMQTARPFTLTSTEPFAIPVPTTIAFSRDELPRASVAMTIDPGARMFDKTKLADTALGGALPGAASTPIDLSKAATVVSGVQAAIIEGSAVATKVTRSEL